MATRAVELEGFQQLDRSDENITTNVRKRHCGIVALATTLVVFSVVVFCACWFAFHVTPDHHSKESKPTIEHVVLLMMENRPFDFYFGWAGKELPGIDALRGDEFNYYNVSNHSMGFEKVSTGALYVCKYNTENGYKQWKDGFFGPGVWDGFSRPYPNATMNGFLQTQGGKKDVMLQMSPEQIPVKMALAKEFAVFDKWHTSVPSNSAPNHLFSQLGTSGGCTTTGCTYHGQPGKTFPAKTIYQSLAEANKSWAYFYNDSAWNDFIDFFNTPEGKAGMRPYDEFFAQARDGTLPHYSWVLPRQGKNKTTGEGANDEHPCNDIALGERLLKDTYEALRAGKGWNKTLLIVTYDDAGGYFDHVAPPVGIPAPDDEPSSPDKTDFTWGGPRVPTLLISPWVSKGRVIKRPTAEPGSVARPFSNSEYEHTSLLAFLKHNFDLSNFLTKRDAWAASFHEELTEAEPRVDTLMHTPEAPPPSVGVDLEDRDANRVGLCAVHGGTAYCNTLTRRQTRRVAHWEQVNEVKAPSDMTQDQAEEWIQAQFRQHFNIVGNTDELGTLDM